MNCPYCGGESRVVDSRPTEDGNAVRRRRECLHCSRRFTTYEIVETEGESVRPPLLVIKRDGNRQSFDRTKLLNSMVRACEKRSVSPETIQAIADGIEQELQSSPEREVPSERIGDRVMEELRKVDEVAYVRFASVYRQFRDLDSFMKELTGLLEDKSRAQQGQ